MEIHLSGPSFYSLHINTCSLRGPEYDADLAPLMPVQCMPVYHMHRNNFLFLMAVDARGSRQSLIMNCNAMWETCGINLTFI